MVKGQKKVSDHLFIRIEFDEERAMAQKLLEAQEHSLVCLEQLEEVRDGIKEKRAAIAEARETLREIKRRFAMLKEAVPVLEEEEAMKKKTKMEVKAEEKKEEKEEERKKEEKKVEEKAEEKGKGMGEKEEKARKIKLSERERLLQELSEIREKLKSLRS
jgi:chromosome segregation ATPase